MFVLFAMVLFVANVCHVPELLLRHVAFMVSAVLLSLQVTYSLVGGHLSMLLFVGLSPVWYGAWFVVLFALALLSDHCSSVGLYVQLV